MRADPGSALSVGMCGEQFGEIQEELCVKVGTVESFREATSAGNSIHLRAFLC